MSGPEDHVDVAALTVTQYRRFQALVLVRILFPEHGPLASRSLADWILTGKSS